MSTLDTQFGVVDEVTYGTPVTVARFFEVNSVPVIKPDVSTVESTAVRSGDYGQRQSLGVRIVKGGTCSLDMPFPTKGGAWWLKHLLGAVSTGSVVDSNYTHTGTIATLIGDSFTAQTGMPPVPSGTNLPRTGHGGKVVSWEMSCDVDGILNLTADLDFEDVDTSTGLATPSYVSTASVFAWNSGSMTIGGVSTPMRNVKFGCNLQLDTKRHFMRGLATSRLKLEPNTIGKIIPTWSADLEFTDNTQYDRWVSAVQATNYAALIFTYNGPIALAGATLPSVVATIPAARFDMVDFSTGIGQNMIQSVSGVGHIPTGGGSALTLAVTNNDATP